MTTRRLWLAAVAVAGVAAAAVLYSFRPGGADIYPSCPFHALTGLHCPGCGTLRALHGLLHGRFIAALGLNVLTVLSIPFLAYVFTVHAVAALRGRPPPAARPTPRLAWSLLGVVLAYWVLRNVPVYPLSLLAP
ncbi:MAG: DUF2752 domain-containing protein [Planctomycetota bacterium]